MGQKREPLLKWISIIYRYSLMYAKDRLRGLDITAGQLPFFIAVVDMAGIRQDELSSYLKVNKGTTAKAVKALEKKGYIIRKQCKHDRRVYRLFPSGRAIELRKKIRNIALEWENVLLEGIAEPERAMLRRVMERMAANTDRFMERRNGKG